MRPEGAKAWVRNPCILTLLPFQGALYRFISTQGVALGYVLVGLSARSLNACCPLAANPSPGKHIARPAPIPATSVQGPPRRSTGGQGAPRRSTGVQGTPRRGNERSRPAPKGQQAVEAGSAFHGIRAFRALSPKKIAFSAKKTSESLLGKKKVVLLHPHSGCSSVRLEYASGGRVVAGSNPVIPTSFP